MASEVEHQRILVTQGSGSVQYLVKDYRPRGGLIRQQPLAISMARERIANVGGVASRIT